MYRHRKSANKDTPLKEEAPLSTELQGSESVRVNSLSHCYFCTTVHLLSILVPEGIAFSYIVCYNHCVKGGANWQQKLYLIG